MSVCISFVDIQYPTYFQIYLAFICFILPLQKCLTVLQYLTIMKLHNCQGELQSHLSQSASVPSYLSVCVRLVDI